MSASDEAVEDKSDVQELVARLQGVCLTPQLAELSCDTEPVPMDVESVYSSAASTADDQSDAPTPEHDESTIEELDCSTVATAANPFQPESRLVCSPTTQPRAPARCKKTRIRWWLLLRAWIDNVLWGSTAIVRRFLIDYAIFCAIAIVSKVLWKGAAIIYTSVMTLRILRDARSVCMATPANRVSRQRRFWPWSNVKSSGSAQTRTMDRGNTGTQRIVTSATICFRTLFLADLTYHIFLEELAWL